MSQEDYDIENQSFPSFRADLNNNLGAIATNNSGAVEPVTKFPYMLWADTTAGIMKQRNAANTAWIEVWDLIAGIVIEVVPTGTLSDFAGSAAPTGYVLCDGATLDSVADTTLASLFAVIGTTYGGIGADDFNVPDFRGRIPIGLDNLGGTPANRMTNGQADILGGAGGVEDVSLIEAQNGPHTHTGGTHTHTGGAHTHDYNDPNTLSVTVGTTATGLHSRIHDPGTTTSAGAVATTSAGAVATTSSGSGAVHANDQPWMAVTKIIKK